MGASSCAALTENQPVILCASQRRTGDDVSSTDKCPRPCPGVFVDNAISLIPVPAWTESDMHRYAARAYKDALAVGLTSIHDAMSTPARIAFFKK
jgi:hypothetical protein